MRNVNYFILIFFSLLVSTAGAAETMQCPPFVEVNQQAENVLKGWQAYEPSTKHPLVAISFYEGEPTEKVLLLPTGEGRSDSTWTFSPTEEGYWVSCGYNSTSIVIARKLPPATISCQVEYDDDFTPPIAKNYTCIER